MGWSPFEAIFGMNHMIENLSPVGGTRRGNVETAFFPQIYVLMSSAYYC